MDPENPPGDDDPGATVHYHAHGAGIYGEVLLEIGYPPRVLTDIRSQTAEELEAQFQAWGQPAYRVAQLLEWLYVHRATRWEAMTNLPKALRDELREHYSLTALELVRKQGARDTTQKFLWRLSDHSLIESVLIPANPALYGEASDRPTLCVSTQVGCAYGCKFCASGLKGWKRNLDVEEIVGQVLAVERWNAEEGRRVGVQSPKSKVQSLECEVERQGLEAGSQGPESSVKDHAPRTTHHNPPRFVSTLVIGGRGEPLANYEN